MQAHRSAPRGAGGKSGGGGAELRDSLRSTQTADVLDLISEGEIAGLVNGLKSIYLDGVPLQNADDSFNFEGVQVQLTVGTQGQAAIAGADGVATEVGVAVPVTAATPIVRAVVNAAVDTLRVTIDVPQLTRQDTGSGDLTGSSFEWAVDVQSAGGGFVEVLRDTVSGKTTSRYTRSKEFALPGVAPWDVRLRRITPDSTSAAEVNEFRWASYTEVQSLKLRYPNSALARVRVGAQQFSRIPTRAYDVAGLIVRVPTNYDPIAKTYSGVWDGTFKMAWTDCPAWVFFDAVTQPRYGLGRYFPAPEALKWDLYTIGRYSDELVPDGNGGWEPRFRCGIYLTTREQAYKVVTDLAAVFRGMAYWAGSDIGATQDAPADPVALFTNANTVPSKPGVHFTYTGGSHSKRHSQVVVWFNSLADLGKLVPEVVVDRALQARYGIRSLELSPLGIWSRGQAQRLGKWVLYSEQREGQGVSFRVGMDGVLLAPGRVFQIADPAEAGERLGGRVRSATMAAVTLDKAVTLAPGEAYTLSVMLQDPANPARLVPEKRPVTNAAGSHQVLNVSPGFSSAPAAQVVWVLQGTSVQATSWRCLGVLEVPGTNDYEITGIRHEPEKYALIEQGITFEPASVSRIRRVPLAPASVSITEAVYGLGLERRSRATVSWPEPAPGMTYLVTWRLGNGPWVELAATSANCVEVDGLLPGLLQVVVKARNALGRTSPGKEGSLEVLGNQVALGSNLVDPTWWRPGVALEWPPVDAPLGESEIVWAVGPRGNVQALWRATAGASVGSADDGGYHSGDPNAQTWPKALARIDPSKTYRFALPVRRVAGTGAVYAGPGYQDGTLASWARVCTLNTTVAPDGPHFWAAPLPQVGRWYLVVGYVFPAGSTGVPADAGGLFDMDTGAKVASTTSYCWKAGISNVGLRAVQAGVPAGEQLLLGPPTVELVNGTDGAWVAGPPGADGVDGVDGVDGADGPPGNKFVRVYKRAMLPPATPVGNNVPAGWSLAAPAPDGTPLWATEAEQTALGVTVGAWSTPVQMDATPGAGPVADLGWLDVYHGPGTGLAAASVRFRRDGSIESREGAASAWVPMGQWYRGGAADVGDTHWLRAVNLGGDALNAGTLDTWLQLNVDREFTQSLASGPAIERTGLQYRISTSSGGSPIVCSGQGTLEAEHA